MIDFATILTFAIVIISFIGIIVIVFHHLLAVSYRRHCV